MRGAMRGSKMVAAPKQGAQELPPDFVVAKVFDEDGECVRVLRMERYVAAMFAAFQSIHTTTSVVIEELR